MKMRLLASSLITGLILGSFGSAALGARLDPDRIQFHPTLLTEPTPLDPENTARASKSTTSSNHTLSLAEPSTPARYDHTLRELELQHGVYAAELREPLLAQASAYLESGNPKAALLGLERAMQLTRVHEGLDSIEQVPIMRTMISAHVEVGDLPDAHRLQEAMLHVQLSHHGGDSVAAVPAILEWADWNVNLYLSDKRETGNPLRETLAEGTSTSEYANPFIEDAHAHYLRALEILHRQSDPRNEHLVTIERKLAALNFMVDKDMLELLAGPEDQVIGEQFGSDNVTSRVRNFHFTNGVSALERALAYGYLSPEPDHDYIVARMLELADWNLLFDHRNTALDLYEQTLALLAESQVPQEEIDRVFAAGLPVATPDIAYQKHPESYAGYIDVEFKVSKYGSASDARLLAEPAADPEVVEELFSTIRNGKFRPALARKGDSPETVKLRYFYSLL